MGYLGTKQEDQDNTKILPEDPDWCPMHYHGQRKNDLLPSRPLYPGITELASLLDHTPKVRVRARRKGRCLPGLVNRMTQ